MIGRLGSTELLIILGIVLLIFGPSKLPELGKSIGKGIRELKQSTKELQDSIDIESEDSEKQET